MRVPEADEIEKALRGNRAFTNYQAANWAMALRRVLLLCADPAPMLSAEVTALVGELVNWAMVQRVKWPGDGVDAVAVRTILDDMVHQLELIQFGRPVDAGKPKG